MPPNFLFPASFAAPLCSFSIPCKSLFTPSNAKGTMQNLQGIRKDWKGQQNARGRTAKICRGLSQYQGEGVGAGAKCRGTARFAEDKRELVRNSNSCRPTAAKRRNDVNSKARCAGLHGIVLTMTASASVHDCMAQPLSFCRMFGAVYLSGHMSA